MQEKRESGALLPVDDRISTYDEIEATYTKDQAKTEAARCLKCPTHWCQKKCPAGVPVTDFIEAFRNGDAGKAYEIIRTASTLPEICSRVCPMYKQCQSECTRSINTEAVGTGNLERYVTELFYQNNGKEKNASKTGKKVAVIGSGPAGLSAAQKLTELGEEVTIYEKDDRAGGLLEYGIPNMKLEKGIVGRKVDSLKEQGVKILTDTTVGKDVSKDTLLGDFDAVVLAVGTRSARMINVPDIENTKGVYTAVEYLSSTTKSLLDSGMKDGKNISGKDLDVVIVGGGDTGNDCVGTAIRNGAKSVTQIEMMPKHTGKTDLSDERVPKIPYVKTNTSQEEARIVFAKDPHVYQTTVKSIEKDANGRISKITTIDLDPVMDDTGRLIMNEVEGTQKTYPCGLLLVAAGFTGPEKEVVEAFGVDVGQRTNINTDDYLTSSGKVFACGDCRTGQSLVVKAMADGRDCAVRVHEYLNA